MSPAVTASCWVTASSSFACSRRRRTRSCVQSSTAENSVNTRASICPASSCGFRLSLQKTATILGSRCTTERISSRLASSAAPRMCFWQRPPCRARGRDVPVIAKLEKPEAIENLDAILRVADGVMVARGDLGVEMSPEKVPVVQKQIIAKACEARLPVITATQMLESMTQNPRPTRAEASDVANAVFDGSDALMLSAETATGAYPRRSGPNDGPHHPRSRVERFAGPAAAPGAIQHRGDCRRTDLPCFGRIADEGDRRLYRDRFDGTLDFKASPAAARLLRFRRFRKHDGGSRSTGAWCRERSARCRISRNSSRPPKNGYSKSIWSGAGMSSGSWRGHLSSSGGTTNFMKFHVIGSMDKKRPPSRTVKRRSQLPPASCISIPSSPSGRRSCEAAHSCDRAYRLQTCAGRGGASSRDSRCARGRGTALGGDRCSPPARRRGA